MTESVAGPSGPGTVILELGADVGALVLLTPAELDGREIEISRDDAPAGRRTHSQVRPRHMPASRITRQADLDLPAVQLGRGEQDQGADIGAQLQDHGSRARRPSD